MITNVKLVSAFLISLVLAACSNGSDQSPKTAISKTPNEVVSVKTQLTDEERALVSARSAIGKYQLTAIAKDCVKVEIESSTPEVYEMVAYEIHNEKCGGDPQTQSRLFGMNISHAGDQISTDAKSDSGEFEPLE